MLKILFILMFISGCGGGGHFDPYSYHYPPTNLKAVGAVKTGSKCILATNDKGVPVGPVESSPVVWRGEVVLVSGNSMQRNSSIRIDSFDCKREIALVHIPQFNYVSAFVDQGTMYIFGTVNTKTVKMIQSADLVNWSSPVDVLTAPDGVLYYNTTITKDPQGFTMLIDHNEGPLWVFDVARSTDLVHWAREPFIINKPGGFLLCPQILFNQADSNYYMLYTDWVDNRYAVFVARSPDLHSWELSDIPAFVPSPGEGNNNSDIGAVEFNGKMYFAYAYGDQAVTWLGMSTATFEGTLDQYAKLFF